MLTTLPGREWERNWRKICNILVNAFVLPHPERPVGVVFWEPRRPRRAARGTATAPGDEKFAVYAPEPVSAAEATTLQAAYHASLGEALRLGERTAGASGVLLLWWVLGVVGAVLLTLRAVEWGIGMTWLVGVAMLFTLPLARFGGDRPFPGGRYSRARRLALHLDVLPEVAGDEPRLIERSRALWQVARRLRGSTRDQLSGLEAHCRENGWTAVARFYRDRLELLNREVLPARRRLVTWRPRFAGRSNLPYTMVEMGAR
jgi:hypothetical protein